MKSHNETTKLISRVNRQFNHLISQLPSRPVTALVVVVFFGVIGTVLLTGSKAATPTANLEAEAGSANGCVTQLTDGSASQNGAVKFGSCNVSDPSLLDASGATIPDTNYTIPSGAIFMATTGNDANAGTQTSPVQTINKALSLVASGGTIVIRGGTYHDWYHNSGNTSFSILTKSVTLQAYPHEKVWFDGSDTYPSSDWAVDGAGHYAKAWSTPQFCSTKYYQYKFDAQPTSSAPCTNADRYGSSVANYPAAGDPQMVFKDGVRIPEVTCHAVGSSTLDFSRLVGDTFCYEEDTTNQTGTLYLGFNPAGHTIDLGVRPTFLVTGYPDIKIYGLGFKRYATDSGDSSNTNSVLYLKGNRTILENDVFTQNASQAVGLGSSTSTGTPTGGSVINHSIFANNGGNGVGFNGLGGSSSTGADHFVIQNSVFNNNNTEKFDMNCSLSCAAAAVKTAHMDGYTIANNLFENTQNGAGAWCDTDCHGGVFVKNLVKNNGTAGYNYEQDDTGIVAGNVLANNGENGIIVSANGTKIWNNTIVGNGHLNTPNAIQIKIYDDSRPTVTGNISIGNNVVEHDLTSGNVFYAAGYGTNYPSAYITYFDYNSWWRPVTNSWMYRMINATDTHFSASNAFHTAYPNFEANAVNQDFTTTTDPFFTNLAGGDYTIRSNSAAYHSGGALPSDVAAALGVSATAGQTRGAFSWPGQ